MADSSAAQLEQGNGPNASPGEESLTGRERSRADSNAHLSIEYSGEALTHLAEALSTLASVPLSLQVTIPVTCFKLQALRSLQPGNVVSSNWSSAEDLPITSGGIRLAWAEFAIADQKRSVRVTRIS